MVYGAVPGQNSLEECRALDIVCENSQCELHDPACRLAASITEYSGLVMAQQPYSSAAAQATLKRVESEPLTLDGDGRSNAGPGLGGSKIVFRCRCRQSLCMCDINSKAQSKSSEMKGAFRPDISSSPDVCKIGQRPVSLFVAVWLLSLWLAFGPMAMQVRSECPLFPISLAPPQPSPARAKVEAKPSPAQPSLFSTVSLRLPSPSQLPKFAVRSSQLPTKLPPPFSSAQVPPISHLD